MTNIDSKLHFMMDLMKVGRLAEPVFDKGNHAMLIASDEARCRSEKFFKVSCSNPRFVFTGDLVQMAIEDEPTKSMQAMLEAGVLHLPYPIITVEVVNPNRKDFYVVNLTEEKGWFGATVASTTLRSIDPFVMVMDFVAMSRYHIDEEGKIAVETRTEGDEKLIYTDELMRPYLRAILIATLCATVMLQTLGLKREVVDEPRLSVARTSRGKSPILPYTRISIGKVYRKDDGDESDEYVPGKSPRPHWRRGHTRRYHYGAGRAETRVRWIPARMVALAKPPEYRVTT